MRKTMRWNVLAAGLILSFVCHVNAGGEPDRLHQTYFNGRLKLDDFIGASKHSMVRFAGKIDITSHSSASHVSSPVGSDGGKSSAEQVLRILKEGNTRFYQHKSLHPHQDAKRLHQAGSENQADHAIATVLASSDSRVPVEILFDAGIMDLFVIRVAGNICDRDEIGSIEYGVLNVNTPLLVIMGNTRCGTVTAATQAQLGQEVATNIPGLIDKITPAVKKVIHDHPNTDEKTLVEYGIEENVWQAIHDLFKHSPDLAKAYADGQFQVAGAIYDVGSGKVNFLDPQKPQNIFLSIKH